MSGSTPVLVADIDPKWLDGVDVNEIGHITIVKEVDGVNYIFSEVKLNEKVVWFVLPLVGAGYNGFLHDMKKMGFAVLLQNRKQTLRLLLKCYLDEEQTCVEQAYSLPPSFYARYVLARKVLLVASERLLADKTSHVKTVLSLSADFQNDVEFVASFANTMRSQ